MVQVRNQTQNDIDYPSKGLLIWHVDARLSAGNCDYEYDNSYSDHKLLRLMEADGLEEIEQGYSADAGDYYVTGAASGIRRLPTAGSTTALRRRGSQQHIRLRRPDDLQPELHELPDDNGPAFLPSERRRRHGLQPDNHSVGRDCTLHLRRYLRRPSGRIDPFTRGAFIRNASNTGNYNFTVTATDSGSCAGSRNYTLSVCSSEVPADVAASNNRCGDVQVTWSPVSGATSYNVTGNGMRYSSEHLHRRFKPL